jgi:hypothetical protein
MAIRGITWDLLLSWEMGFTFTFIMRNGIYFYFYHEKSLIHLAKLSFIATRMSVGSAHFTSNHRLKVPVQKFQSSFMICVVETVNNICVIRGYAQNWMTRMKAYTNLRAVILSLFCPLRIKTFLYSLIPIPGGNKYCRIKCKGKVHPCTGTEALYKP